MNQPTKEQQQWFWEQGGFHYEKSDSICFPNSHSFWVYPDGSRHSATPLVDLNNLFKYAVPKLDKSAEGTDVWITGLDITFSYGAHQGGIICGVRAEVLVKSIHHTEYSSIAGTPALALFWAIFKALE